MLAWWQENWQNIHVSDIGRYLVYIDQCWFLVLDALGDELSRVCLANALPLVLHSLDCAI